MTIPCLWQFSKHLFTAWEIKVVPTVRRRLGDQSGAVCQQSSERHAFDVAADSTNRSKFGHVLCQWVFQLEPSLIPQLHNGSCRECLSH